MPVARNGCCVSALPKNQSAGWIIGYKGYDTSKIIQQGTNHIWKGEAKGPFDDQEGANIIVSSLWCAHSIAEGWKWYLKLLVQLHLSKIIFCSNNLKPEALKGIC